MSDTPLTDAAIIERGEVLHNRKNGIDCYVEMPDRVSADYARSLERKLRAAEKALQQIADCPYDEGVAISFKRTARAALALIRGES